MALNRSVGYSNWYFVTILYIVFDYGRPTDILPIGFLRPLMYLNIILIFYVVTKGLHRAVESPQLLYIWIFIAILGVFVLFARNNFYAYVTARNQLLFMPFIISIVACINSHQRLRQTINICIGLMIWISLYAVTHSGHGPGNYFTDENDLCLYINMWLPFCYFFFFSEKNIKRKLFYATGLLTGLFAVVASFSRGGFIGILAVAGTISLVSKRKTKGLIGLLIVAVALLFIGDESYWSEMSTVTNIEDGTAQARIESWKAGLRMFADNPLGVGGNNFQVRFDEYQGDWFKRGMWGRVAHSLWITLLTELGIIGTVVYLLILYKNLKDLQYIRKKIPDAPQNSQKAFLHTLSLSYFASLAGYFASGTFLSVLYYAHYWYMTGLIIATYNLARKMNGGRNHPRHVTSGSYPSKNISEMHESELAT